LSWPQDRHKRLGQLAETNHRTWFHIAEAQSTVTGYIGVPEKGHKMHLSKLQPNIIKHNNIKPTLSTQRASNSITSPTQTAPKFCLEANFRKLRQDFEQLAAVSRGNPRHTQEFQSCIWGLCEQTHAEKISLKEIVLHELSDKHQDIKM